MVYPLKEVERAAGDGEHGCVVPGEITVNNEPVMPFASLIGGFDKRITLVRPIALLLTSQLHST